MKHLALFLAAALLAAGCAQDLSPRGAAEYAEYARSCDGWQAQNQWWKAQQNCSRAALNADLGGAPEQTRAALWYEYGRTSGAICDYVEAKRGLDTALELDGKSGGPIFATLLELARLHLDQGKFKEASGYFQRFESAVPKDRALKADPVGYAETLEEFATAAERSGEPQRAKDLRSRAQELRTANPSRSSRTERTPYGKYCHQRS
jgi:tetratricopeptide (TPR) repeat protein